MSYKAKGFFEAFKAATSAAASLCTAGKLGITAASAHSMRNAAGMSRCGAAIETFGIEPVPPDWELLRLDNVILTPHIAGASVKTVKYAAGAVAKEVRRYLAGEAPANPC